MSRNWYGELAGERQFRPKVACGAARDASDTVAPSEEGQPMASKEAIQSAVAPYFAAMGSMDAKRRCQSVCPGRGIQRSGRDAASRGAGRHPSVHGKDPG